MRKRYPKVFFPMAGLQMEGMLISTGRKYFRIKTFFSGNIYRVKRTKVFSKPWVKEG